MSEYSGKLVAATIGGHCGTVALYINCDASGIATLHPWRDTYFERDAFTCITVPIVTLDDTVEQERIDAMDCVKMDIEGHGLQALEGARRALAGKRIRTLAFEFGSANLNSRTLF